MDIITTRALKCKPSPAGDIGMALTVETGYSHWRIHLEAETAIIVPVSTIII